MIITLALANTCITSHNYHFFFVVRTFKIHSLRNFQTYNIPVGTVITMLNVRSPNLINLKCVPSDQHVPISLTHQPLDNYRSSLFLMLVFPFLTSVTQHFALFELIELNVSMCMWTCIHWSHLRPVTSNRQVVSVSSAENKAVMELQKSRQ